MRLTWDQFGSMLAETAAMRSDCTRSRVGAVLMDPDHRVVALGYNGAPAGMPGCESCPRRLSECESGAPYDGPTTWCNAVHAEANCLLYAGRDRAKGGTLYVTREPCHECARLIQAAGIARVVVGDKYE